MNRGLSVDKPQSVIFKELEEPTLQNHQVRIQTEFASIKHGTEFHLFSGKSPFQGRRFDGSSRLFVEKEADTPDTDSSQLIGNTIVGRIVEVGNDVTKFAPGDRVYGYHPASETAVMSQEHVHLLTPPLTEQDAVCLDPALFAYAAVRDGRVCLGDNGIVFGLGAIGLLLVQMLRVGGCANIIAVDPVAKRRQVAETYGATLTLDPTQCDVAWKVREVLGQGADIGIEASGSYGALHTAMRSVQQCARIVTLGYYHGKDTELELGAEWFHNRLELICSMPGWGNPSREHPLWSENRLVRSVKEMFRKQVLSSEGIVDPIVPFEEAANAFLEAYYNPAGAIKLGIRF